MNKMRTLWTETGIKKKSARKDHRGERKSIEDRANGATGVSEGNPKGLMNCSIGDGVGGGGFDAKNTTQR